MGVTLTKTSEGAAGDLLTQWTAREAQRRREAGALYRTLLRRAGTPQPGDVEQLAEVMAILGRTSEHLEEDRATVAQLEEIDQAEATLSELRVQRDAAYAALKRVRAEIAAERAACEERWHARDLLTSGAYGVAQDAWSGADSVVSRGRPVRNRWAAFIEDVPVQTVELREKLTYQAPVPPTREELLQKLRMEFIHQGFRPVAGRSIHAAVDDALAAAGEEPLTEAERKEHFGRLGERFDVDLKPAARLPDDARP